MSNAKLRRPMSAIVRPDQQNVAISYGSGRLPLRPHSSLTPGRRVDPPIPTPLNEDSAVRVEYDALSSKSIKHDNEI